MRIFGASLVIAPWPAPVTASVHYLDLTGVIYLAVSSSLIVTYLTAEWVGGSVIHFP